MSAADLVWRAAGSPAPPYPIEPCSASCGTCGRPISSGVDFNAHINNPTFSVHSDYLRFGPYVCAACAWLYSEPKRAHRNMLAVGETLYWPVIGADSESGERPQWRHLLSRISMLAPLTPVAGVLTTDPKPRNWPRMQPACVGAFGLFTHAPEYDVSEYRRLDLPLLLRVTADIALALQMGFAKRAIAGSLLMDYARARRNMQEVMRLEQRLAPLRSLPEWVPALVITQVRKDERAIGLPESHRAARDQADQAQPRLL